MDEKWKMCRIAVYRRRDCGDRSSCGKGRRMDGMGRYEEREEEVERQRTVCRCTQMVAAVSG